MVIEANCPTQKMNIHLISSDLRLARSVLVATFSSSLRLLVSIAFSTAEVMTLASGSLNFCLKISNIFKVLTYDIYFMPPFGSK